jgi:ATP-dependent Clp protease ATP-binding subunit ClpA
VTALQFHGVSITALRADVARLLPPRSDTASSRATDLVLAPDAQAVFTAACAEAHALEHSYLATEHVLLGLLSDPDTAFAQMLAARHFTLIEARARIRWILESDPLDPPTYISPRPTRER